MRQLFHGGFIFGAQFLVSSIFAQEPPRTIPGPWPSELKTEPAGIVFDDPVFVPAPAVPNGVKQFAYSPDYQHVMWLEERGFKTAIFVDGKEIIETEAPSNFAFNEDFSRMRFSAKGSTPQARRLILVNPEGRRVVEENNVIAISTSDSQRARWEPGPGSALGVGILPRPDRVVLKVDEKTFDVDGKVIKLSGPLSTASFRNGGRHAVVIDGAREFQVYVNGELRGGRAPQDGINVTEEGRAWCTGYGTLWVDGQLREISKDVQHPIVTPDLKHAFQIHKSTSRLYLDGQAVAEGYENYVQPTMMPDGKGFVVGYVRNGKPGLLADTEPYSLDASVDRIKYSPKGDRLAVLLKNGALIVNGVLMKEQTSTGTFVDGSSLMNPSAAELQFTPDSQHVFWPSQNKSLPEFWVDGNRTASPQGVYAVSDARFTSDSTFEYFGQKDKKLVRVTGRLVPVKEWQAKSGPKPNTPAPEEGTRRRRSARTPATQGTPPVENPRSPGGGRGRSSPARGEQR